MKVFRTLILLVFCFQIVESAAQTTRPHLRIETGAHTASVWGVASDDRNRYIATASEDRTIRVWDAFDKRLIQTIRPFYISGNQGKFFTLDISPNGKWIAAGGKMSPQEEAKDWLYLFDIQTGEVIRRIGNVPGRIFHVRFSPDGKLVLAALERGLGIVLYEAATGKVIASDTAYEGDIYGAEFDRQGRSLVTTSFDGHLRLYKLAGQSLTLTDKLKVGDQPYSVSISADGTKAVAGFLAKTRVDVYSLANGKIGNIRTLDVRRLGTDAGTHVANTCFSTNGKYIYASGNSRNRDDFQIIRKWDAASGAFAEDALVPNYATVLKLVPLANDRLLFATAAPDWGILAANGRIAFAMPVSICDFSGQAGTLGISGNGLDVKLRLGKDSFRESFFSLNRLVISETQSGGDAYLSPFQPKDLVDQWENSTEVVVHGKNIALSDNETSYSAAVAGEKSRVVLGTDRAIRCYGADARLLWQQPSPEVVWAVNITRDDKTIVALLGDGTVRWYSMANGEELLAAFIHSDQKRWIAWKPAGQYACSVGGEELVGWQLNRGADKPSRFFPLSKFRKEYYHPDLIRTSLIASTKPVQPVPPIQIEKKLPPLVTILGPENNAEITSSVLTISYRVESDGPVINTKVLLNGRPSTQPRGLKPAKDVLTMQVALSSRDTVINVMAENENGFGPPATVRIRNAALRNPAEKVRRLPSLYVLAIGVSAYRDEELKLNFAAKDAEDFTRLLMKQKGKLYDDVQVKLMTDKDATKQQIVDGLKWLQTQTKPEDSAVLFMAGHGFNDDQEEFYYVPVEADPNRLVQTGVHFEDILRSITNIPGKIVFFIDACHSGNVMGKGRRRADLTKVANISASPENGIVVFTSSTAGQLSYEDAKWGNGAFTKATVEGMEGKADLFKKGTVTVKNLDAYISNRVHELTQGIQLPTTIIPMSIPDFSLLLLK